MSWYDEQYGHTWPARYMKKYRAQSPQLCLRNFHGVAWGAVAGNPKSLQRFIRKKPACDSAGKMVWPSTADEWFILVARYFAWSRELTASGRFSLLEDSFMNSYQLSQFDGFLRLLMKDSHPQSYNSGEVLDVVSTVAYFCTELGTCDDLCEALGVVPRFSRRIADWLCWLSWAAPAVMASNPDSNSAVQEYQWTWEYSDIVNRCEYCTVVGSHCEMYMRHLTALMPRKRGEPEEVGVIGTLTCNQFQHVPAAPEIFDPGWAKNLFSRWG